MRAKHLNAVSTNLALLLLGVMPVLFVASWLWLNRSDGIVGLLPKLPVALLYNLIIFAIPLVAGCLAHYALVVAGGLVGGRLRVASVVVSTALVVAVIAVVGWRNLHSLVTSALAICASLAYGLLARLPSDTQSRMS